MLNSGDDAPVITAGNPQSLLLRLITGHTGVDPKTGQAITQMPPTKLLDQQYIDMITQWVMAGMPQTAQDAAKVTYAYSQRHKLHSIKVPVSCEETGTFLRPAGLYSY